MLIARQDKESQFVNEKKTPLNCIWASEVFKNIQRQVK